MIPNAILTISTIGALTFGQVTAPQNQGYLLSSHEISLENRYPVKSVSSVFKDNILLNLAYLREVVSSGKNINWDLVRAPFHYEFKLEPNKTFAFHGDILDKYRDMVVKTTSAHFNSQEGFKTDGYLFGDGVCHLASLINWVARDAKLDSYAPTNHDFAKIPEINQEYGVSIYSSPYSSGSNKAQNLYVTNILSKPITFNFDYAEDKLRVSIVEID